MLQVLLIASFLDATFAAPNVPITTPAVMLPRTVYQTLGWYLYPSQSVQGIVWVPWVDDQELMVYTTSNDWFRRCPRSSSCTMFTGCSDGFLVAESTSSYCGHGTGAYPLNCGKHLSYKSFGASKASSWYWCDKTTLTGLTIYGQDPRKRISTARPESTPSTTLAMTTLPESSTLRTMSTGSRTLEESTPARASASSTGDVVMIPSLGAPRKNRTATDGLVAGSVVGGVVALVAIGLALLLFLRRKKNTWSTPPESPLPRPEHRDQVFQSRSPEPRAPLPPPTVPSTSGSASSSEKSGMRSVDRLVISPPPYYQSPVRNSSQVTSDRHISSTYSPTTSHRFSRPPTLPPPRLTESLLSEDVKHGLHLYD